MSLNRITAAQKIISSSKKVCVPNLVRVARWNSTGSSAGSLTAMRVFVYGVTTAGVVVGGSLIYANYNPSFRYKVGKYIPVFAGLADHAADKWVEVVDKIKRKPSDNVGLKKDFESVLESRMQSAKKAEDSEMCTPSVVVSKTIKQDENLLPSKEKSSLESDTKESTPQVSESQSSSHKTSSAVKDVPISSSKESSEESIKDTTDVAIAGESVPSSSQVVSILKEKELSALIDEKQDVVVECQSESVPEPKVPVMVGAVTPVIEDTTGESIAKETEESPSADNSFEDAAQVKKRLQEVYKKYQEFDNRTYELYKVLMQAEKYRQEKLAVAMKVDTDNKTTMQSIAEDMAKSEEEVQNAEEKVAASQVETTEVGKKLALLLNRASDLGLKSKVEEIRSELSQLHARAMMGAVDYAKEKLNSDLMKEYQQELKKAKDWIKSELGTTLPEASSQQEALILMLQKRAELLLQKFEEAEKEYRNQLAAGRERAYERVAPNNEVWLQLNTRRAWPPVDKNTTHRVYFN